MSLRQGIQHIGTIIKYDGDQVEDLSTELDSQETITTDQEVIIDNIIAALQNKSAGGGIIPTGTLSITENGDYDVTEYAGANVNVETGETINNQDITVTENGTYTADSEYTGLGEVTVNVPIPTGYIKPSGNINITNTNSTNVTNYATAKVVDSDLVASNIKSGVNILGVTGTYNNQKPEQTKSVTITENGTRTITPDSGKVLSSVSVTANVPIPSGYIKPSGELEITENGTYNVTNYASAEVNIESAGGNTTIEDALVTRSLSGAYVNNRVTSIGTEGLRATQISSLHCENVTTVGGEALRDCKNLVSIYLPKCKTLTGYAVGICPLLERADLDSIETIQAYSFYNCPKLTTVVIRTTSKVCTLANVNAFTGSGIASGTGYIYVPDDLVDSYKTASNWSTYANQIKGLSELEV